MDAPVFQPRDPGFEWRVRESFSRQGAMRLIGARLDGVAAGRCEIHLPYREDLTQQHGFYHGGMVTTVADSAAGYAGFSLMPADATVLTIEFKTNFLAPAHGELLIARGQVIKSGRTVTVAEARAWVVDGGTEKLCATMIQTMMVITHHDEKADR